jgi:RecA/RadA recombinase
MGIIDKLVKRFDHEDVIKFSDKDNFRDVKSWSFTGSPQLEYNLGVLGLPTGMIEIAGPSRSGKTTLGLMGMKYFLSSNPEGVAIILSSENRDNKEYALKLGINPDKVMILKIRYVEEMFMKVKKIINDTKEIFREEDWGQPIFYFMWDSLGATLAKAELDTMEDNTERMEKAMAKGKDGGEVKHAQMGAFAKQAKMFAKFITAEMYDTTIHFIMLNHVYDKMSGMGGKQSGGGKWVEFFPTMRLQMAVIGHEKIDDVEVAQFSKVKVVKNDFGSRKETKLLILLGRGILLSDEDIAFGVEEGIIDKKSATVFSYKGKMEWRSKRTFFALYEEENKMLNLMTKQIMKARHQQTKDERYK